MSQENQPHEKQRSENEIPLSGIFLVFIGTVLLLESAGVVSWSLWNTLWRFWPVLLIITGLSLLLRRYNVWLVSLLLLAVLFACLGVAILQQDKPLPSGQGTTSYPSAQRTLI